MIVLGTRPEAIKLEPILSAMHFDEGLEPIVVSTNQQKDLLPEIEKALSVRATFTPDHPLQGEGASDFVSRALVYLGKTIDEIRPNLILVHGDTSSAFAGALAGFLHGVHVGHVEAGLRTSDLKAPYPEEGYRQMIARIADYHFAPTALSRENLVKEGIATERITVTGNTIVDAVYSMRDKSLISRGDVLRKLGLDSETNYCVVTLHRRENHGERINNALKIIEAELGNSNLSVLIVRHPNPKVMDSLSPLQTRSSNVFVIDPLPYVEFLSLISGASLLITDSGGIQEEAVSLGVGVLVVRDKTERPEGVEAGLITLVGNDAELLADSIRSHLGQIRQNSRQNEDISNPYGDGLASKRILEFISAEFRMP